MVDIWNSLPETLVCSCNISIFKRTLTNFNLDKFVLFN